MTTETFQGFADGNQVSPINVTFGADTAQLAGSAMIIRSSESAGRFAISPTKYLESRPDLTQVRIPEPGVAALLAIGLFGLGAIRRRKRQ